MNFNQTKKFVLHTNHSNISHFGKIIQSLHKLSSSMIPLLIGIIISLNLISPTILMAQQADEYALKASYIEHFVQFVKWPKLTNISTSEPFIINVIGEDPFNGSLEDVFIRNNQNGKEIEIVYIKEIEQIKNCDLLFIADSEKEKLTRILEFVEGKSILTIGDAANYSIEGVIINFYIDASKLHFEINLKAARNSGLEFDPLLLDYAKIIDSAGADNE